MNENIQQNISDTIFVKDNGSVEPLVCLIKTCYFPAENLPCYYRIINGTYGYTCPDFETEEERDKVFDLAVEKLVNGEKLIDFDKLREELNNER